MPDWQGERLSLEREAGAANLQMDLTRHVWALKYVEGQRHLDIGCGTGFGAWLMSQVTDSTTAIDPCAEALQEAQGRYRGDNLRYACCRVEDLAGTSTQYGAVTAFESLEHTEDLRFCLRTIAEYLLDDGGLFLGSVPVCAGENPYHQGRNYNAPQWIEVLSERFAVRWLYYQPIGWPAEAPQPNTDILPLQAAEEIADRTNGNLLFVATRKE